MISSGPKTAECHDVMSGLRSEVALLVELTPVMLRDPAKSFTGSGVILFKDTTRKKMWVVTAKHNLWVYASAKLGYPGDPATWSSNKAQRNDAKIKKLFKDDVLVHYQAADLSATLEETPASTAVASIDNIIFSEDGYTYDACLLEVGYTASETPRMAFFEHFTRRTAISSLIVTLRQLHKNGAMPFQAKLLQAGFGKQGQKKSPGELKDGELLFKVSELANFTPQTFYDEHVGSYESVYELDSDATWTTLPGDSGGPLFLVTPTSCQLVGVSLGSDSFASEELEPSSLATDPDGKYNNTATSLLPLFELISQH